ncbi:LacI family DNA-binding transcriptional regulator [Streptomyces xiamenensis]|uniref:LacI family DNA-binding transcriptional regulator n=1 Tax=Streptomyces xiamenensis TaxID=408015 RepID=UPI0036E379E3
MRTNEAIGLVLARPARLLGTEPFFMEFIAGIEESLSERGHSLLLHIVQHQEEEIATHRRWAERSLVAAVVLVNVTTSDRRPAVLRELGMPAVIAGGLRDEPGIPAVSTDAAGAMREALERLLALGHRRIARVTGPAGLLHTRVRSDTMRAECAAAGIEPQLVEGDYSPQAGERLTAALLSGPRRPTAILYDNDVMAIAGLGAARAAGVAVPAELSLVAWDDSAMCRLTSPPFTTMTVDVHRFGTLVADSVLELIEGRPVGERWSPAARFTPRGTTAPVPGDQSVNS